MSRAAPSRALRDARAFRECRGRGEFEVTPANTPQMERGTRRGESHRRTQARSVILDPRRNNKSSAVAQERDSGPILSIRTHPPLTWMGYFLPSRKGGATQSCNLPLMRGARSSEPETCVRICSDSAPTSPVSGEQSALSQSRRGRHATLNSSANPLEENCFKDRLT
jgi:hypothetical protein